MTLYETLKETGLPCAYSHFHKKQDPPYVVYVGNGQETFSADNTYYYKENSYQVEYYFKQKDEEAEARIEDLLIENGYLYDKSEDVYIESEGVFVIYYYI